MTTATNDAASASAGTLAALRALAVEPSRPLTHLLHAADQQAALLRKLMPSSPVLILEHLPVLFPSIVIEYVDTIPVAGIAFWGNGRWCIHIRASEPMGIKVFTALRELKHVIDHPLLRQQPDPLSDGDWERLADCFAAGVLVGEPDDTTGNRGLPNKQQVPSQSTTKTGGVSWQVLSLQTVPIPQKQPPRICVSRPRASRERRSS